MKNPMVFAAIAVLNFLSAGISYYDNDRPVIMGLQIFAGITMTYVALKLRSKA